MIRAEFNADLAALEAPPSSACREVATKPGIERIFSVRILRGGTGWHGVSLRVGANAQPDSTFDLSLVTQPAIPSALPA